VFVLWLGKEVWVGLWEGNSTFFTVDEVVEVLRADEFVPVVLVGDVLEGLELPGCHLVDS